MLSSFSDQTRLSETNAAKKLDKKVAKLLPKGAKKVATQKSQFKTKSKPVLNWF